MHHDHTREMRGVRLWIVIILNIGITASQIIGGFIAGSLALISDALHNLSDVLALSISLIAHKLTSKKSTSSKTFGYKRAEIMAAFINAASLVIISGFLIVEAVNRLFFETEYFINGSIVMILAGVSIVGNGLSVLVLQKDSKENLNMKSAYLHLFSDMLSSFAVLAGGVMIKYYGVVWVDSLLSVGIAIYLVMISAKLLYRSLTVLMQFTPSNIDIIHIAEAIGRHTEIENIHHVHVWELNENELHFEAHVLLKENLPINDVCSLLQKVENQLQSEFGISHITLQPEFGRDCRQELIAEEDHHYS